MLIWQSLKPREGLIQGYTVVLTFMVMAYFRYTPQSPVDNVDVHVSKLCLIVYCHEMLRSAQ